MLKRLLFLALSLLILAGGGLTAQGVAEIYFQGDTLVELSLSGRAAQATTFTYDAACEQLGIEVTDPDNDPLPASNAYVVRLREADNDQITDLTNRLTVTMRARAAAEVPVQFLFRSEPGSGDFRTAGKEVMIPAGLEEWTEVTVSFDSTNFNSGFDPTQIKDLWFYLDRGTANFPGNQFFVDHIVVGGPADPEQNSPCSLVMGVDGTFVDYFQGDSLTSFTLDNRAGRTANFDFDTVCETLTLSVIDPTNDQLPPFNAFQFNPTNAEGEDITDINGRMNVTMRVRSAEMVNVSVLFRSGGGTMEERTLRKDIDIPGNLEEWTEFTLTFEAADMDGFDPDDLRDVWFYLDRGEPNFAGNFFFIDHIAVGQQPDAAQNSPC
ncbi:MAG: hypothetical protein AAFZ52_15765, partial [Bacteroidota bacterium]